MATTVDVPQTVYHGVDYLSKNVQSSQLHTPSHLDRITTSQEAYNTYLRDYDSYIAKPKWGVSRRESGLVSNQPVLRNNKGSDEACKMQLSHLDKSHLHFGGGGLSYARVLPNKPQYSLTNLKKSDARATDELIAQINSPSSAEHPYSSQIPKHMVFPEFQPQNNTKASRGASERGSCGTSLNGAGVTENIRESIHTSFNQGNVGDRSYFAVSKNTANALRNLHALYNTPEYTQRYTGNGENRSSYGKDVNDRAAQRHPEKRFDGNQTTSGAENRQAIIDIEKTRPYTSTYKADYSIASFPHNCIRVSSMVPKELKKNNKLGIVGNKSVKFCDQVVISDGHWTSSGTVNDLNVVSQPLTQSQSKPSRPSTSMTVRDTLSRGRVQEFSSSAISSIPVRPSTTGNRGRPGNHLLQLQHNFSKSAARRKLLREFPENAPDIRRKPDTRITTNERRHVIPEVGCHSYYFHG